MGIIRQFGFWTGRLAALGLFSVLAVSLWTLLWPAPKFDAIAPHDAIVCLGGGMAKDGTLFTSSRKRVERCVALYEHGLAPSIVFSGAGYEAGGPLSGQKMADYAAELGLPEQALMVEGAARSTLQNALYSLPMLDESARIILVTDAFHLPRSWVSFRWAGAKDMTLVASEPLPLSGTEMPLWLMVLREALAIWFNLARAISYSIAASLGYQNDDWLI